jgi:hypothetical protein
MLEPTKGEWADGPSILEYVEWLGNCTACGTSVYEGEEYRRISDGSKYCEHCP